MGNHAVKDQVLINALDQFLVSGTQKKERYFSWRL